MSTCIENLIGVTDNTNIPFWDDLDPAFKAKVIAGESGLFINDLPGGIDLMAVDELEYMQSVLQLALDAKEEAQKILLDELLLAINSRYQAAKTKFIGEIGRRSVSANLSSNQEYQGQRYRMYEPIAGIIKISKVAICVNGTATFNIYIARGDAGDKSFEVIHTLEVNAVASTWSFANVPTGGITLPMEVNGVEQEYHIFWKRTESGGLLPKNNDIKCGTCGFARATNALSGFMHYNGVAFANENSLTTATTDKYGHGLSISAEVGCDNSTVICREYEKKDAVAKMIQWALMYKAGQLWIEYIFKSGYINRQNLQNRDYLNGQRSNYRKQFDERITAIANEMQLGETNCYTCGEEKGFRGLIPS